MKQRFLIFQIFTFVLLSSECFSQVTISGPGCAVSGTTYQYIISGNWDSSATMQVCITNGNIQNSTGTNVCTAQGTPVNAILVQWDDTNSDTGSITVTSSVGNAVQYISFTQTLLPGLIDSASKVQSIYAGTIPLPINCLPDSGGSCTPSYTYQWQQSFDQVAWQDISGAINSQLQIDSGLTQNMYYRRKVTETISGSIGYSDAASVFILPAADTTSENLINSLEFNAEPWNMNDKNVSITALSDNIQKTPERMEAFKKEHLYQN